MDVNGGPDPNYLLTGMILQDTVYPSNRGFAHSPAPPRPLRLSPRAREGTSRRMGVLLARGKDRIHSALGGVWNLGFFQVIY